MKMKSGLASLIVGILMALLGATEIFGLVDLGSTGMGIVIGFGLLIGFYGLMRMFGVKTS